MNSDKSRNNVVREFDEIDSRGGWVALYQQIRIESLDFDYTLREARRSQNKNLNRYRDVSPYDHSRVVLLRGPYDYINASLVANSKANRHYILTQGPLSQTTGHFWLMVWEQNCRAVVMLNRLVEKRQEKCHQYWPLGTQPGIDDEMVLTDVELKVQYLGEKCASYYTTRTLKLIDMESGNSRVILQFHYTTWPDFGVPQSPTAFLDFLMVVRQSGVLSTNFGPPVIHCSAGIGRSGTFCFVDSCLVLIEENGIETVNVRDVLLELRKFRMGLIQTPDQLRFSYMAIIEGIKRGIVTNSMDKSSFIEAIELTRNNVNSMQLENVCDSETDEKEEAEEPPPPPPPRGESLKKSALCGPEEYNSDNETLISPIGLPPDKPLPVEPSINSSVDDSALEKLNNSDSLDNLSLGDNDLERSVLRQRKQDERNERRERLLTQLREIKRKQEASESWQEWKKSLFSPLNIGVGVGILLIGGGVMAYVYYSNKL